MITADKRRMKFDKHFTILILTMYRFLYIIRSKKYYNTGQYKYSNDVQFGSNVRSRVIQGMNIIANTVSFTLGPQGRYVILEQPNGPPKISKNGFTIAKSIELKDKFQNIGAKLIQSVANKTKENFGDGTSTSIILARAIAKDSLDKILEGTNPIDIRNGIIKAVKVVLDELNKMSKPLNSKEIEHIAILAADYDKVVGKLIATAINKVGKNGVIMVKDSKTLNTELEILEGIKIEKGFVSSYFANARKGCSVEYRNALVLYSEKKIFNPSQIIPALEIARSHKRPLIIIAEDYEDDVLSLLIQNKLKNSLQVAAIKAPGFGEYRRDTLIDLAIITGGIVFEDNSNLIRLEDCEIESLGTVEEVIMTKESTLFLKGAGDEEEITERIEEIHLKLKTVISEYEKTKILNRLSRLKSKVAILYIREDRDEKLLEKIVHANDALTATWAAVQEGGVPGGGTSLLRCIPVLSEIHPANSGEVVGIDIVKKALRIPCKTIINNAGLNGEIITSQVEIMCKSFGYDVLKKKYINMVKEGIIDPTKIVRGALTNASGIASLIITADAVVCDYSKQRRQKLSK